MSPCTPVRRKAVFRVQILSGEPSLPDSPACLPMDQVQMEERPRKRKKQAKLEFDASQVFGTSKDTEIEMDLDSARFKAQKGQGGDRRS